MDLLNNIIKWFNEHILISSMLLSFISCFVRMKGDTIINKLSQGFLCSTLTVGIYFLLINFFTVNENICLAIGSLVGYIGTEQIKEWIYKIINNKIEK